MSVGQSETLRSGETVSKGSGSDSCSGLGLACLSNIWPFKKNQLFPFYVILPRMVQYREQSLAGF
jgi:hypothetical protein